MISKSFALLVICVVPFAGTLKVEAKTFRGPEYVHEIARNPNMDDESSAPRFIRRNRLKLLSPIPGAALGGLFVGRYEYHSEAYSANNAPKTVLRKVDMLGMSYVRQHGNGYIPYVVQASRWGNFYNAPMYEVSGGFNLENTALRWSLSDASTGESWLGFYLRKYPFGFRFIPIWLQHEEFANGWFYHSDFPTTFFVGWKSSDQSTLVELDTYLQALQYPWDEIEGTDDGWIEGYSANILLGMKRRVTGAFFVSLYSGVQTSQYTFRTRHEYEKASYRTPWMPVVQLGLETFFSEF